MFCPKCYGNIQKESGRCLKCGFSIHDLKKASNKEAIKQIRSGNGDMVLQSKILPPVVSKKKLLLYCGLLGIFGAHNFYVGKMFRGFLNLVVSILGVFLLVFSFFEINSGFFKYLEYIGGICFALNIILVSSDFSSILFNKFKVPVYLEEE